MGLREWCEGKSKGYFSAADISTVSAVIEREGLARSIMAVCMLSKMYRNPNRGLTMANITCVLFIGNNFTAGADLPDLLARLVSAGGKG